MQPNADVKLARSALLISVAIRDTRVARATRCGKAFRKAMSQPCGRGSVGREASSCRG